jgi:hypothetical protein
LPTESSRFSGWSTRTRATSFRGEVAALQATSPDSRAEAKKTTNKSAATKSTGQATASTSAEPEVSLSAIATRCGEVVNQVLSDHPEIAPVLEQKAERSRGRPAQDRLYPARPTGEQAPFETAVPRSDLAIETVLAGQGQRTVSGSTLRKTTENVRSARFR